MTRENAIIYLRSSGYSEEQIGEIVKALESQPCEDCISREAVDKYIVNLLSGYLYDEERTRLEDLTAFIWELPSVQPQRKKGKWIIRNLVNSSTKEQDIRIFECSECRVARRELLNDEKYLNFCPNCGAEMRGDDE